MSALTRQEADLCEPALPGALVVKNGREVIQGELLVRLYVRNQENGNSQTIKQTQRNSRSCLGKVFEYTNDPAYWDAGISWIDGRDED